MELPRRAARVDIPWCKLQVLMCVILLLLFSLFSFFATIRDDNDYVRFRWVPACKIDRRRSPTPDGRDGRNILQPMIQ